MSSACLIKDGKLVAAVCEERFTRNKNEQGFPENAIDYCLKEGKISYSEVDLIADSTIELDPVFEAIKRYSTFTIDDYVKENREYWKPVLLEKKIISYLDIFTKKPNKYYDFSFIENNQVKGDKIQVESEKLVELFREQRLQNLINKFHIKKEKIFFVDHHTGHAYYAYFMSPFRKNVLIITADAWGDGCNCSISIGNEKIIDLKFKSANNNLARIYRQITLLLGMKPNEHEYKVMGLAPYATEYQMKKPYEIFKNVLCVDGLDFKYKEKLSDHYYWFKEKLEGCRFDGIAGALQRYVEEIMVEWVTNASKSFGSDTVVLSGGLALNIKINKKLAESQEIKNIFVPGGGGDESQSIGAALYLHNKFENKSEFIVPFHDYHGPTISSDGIEKILTDKKIINDFSIKYEITNKEIAEYLKNDFIVARCSGKSEFGPRALGNRSILSNPSNFKNLKKINDQIKYRDFWMPFTPSILLERVTDYIINPKNIISPFMTMAFESTELARKDLIAALHPADFTIRPQFVDKKYNPDYHNLISNFEKLTGIGGLLNTSLNLHGEPIVGNTLDAIHTMINSDLDLLVIEKTAIFRKKSFKC